MNTDHAGSSPHIRIVWKNRVLDFSKHVYVMGILNVTPDSFYADTRVPDQKKALVAAREMEAAGADIIDVGGESTRPGSEPVKETEEVARVVPVVKELRRQSDIMISVDTRRREVAGAALAAGADMVNTVGGLRGDDDFARLVARTDVPVVLMHMRGTPQTMQDNPYYEDTIGEVAAALRHLADHAQVCGVRRDRIILDPGIGFGKRVVDNLLLIKHLDVLQKEGYPLLMGLSRKSFLGQVTGRPVEERLAGTIAANTVSALAGANILRVHDVREAVDTARFCEALREID